MSVVYIVVDITVFLLVALFWETTELVIKAPQAWNVLFNGATTIVICVLCEMYFEKVQIEAYQTAKTFTEEAHRQASEKESFFATISHEIRNPLQSLLGSVELLQEKSSEDQHRLKTIIKNCCEVVLNIVSNILDVTKIEAQKLELSPVASNLTEAINKILRLSLGRAESKGLKLSYLEAGQIPPSLLFDPQRLHQVILNLTSNAVKFTQKGQIVVRAEWIPWMRTESTGIEELLQRELKTSSWKSVFDPLQEFDDPERQEQKMLRVSGSQALSPSNSTGLSRSRYSG